MKLCTWKQEAWHDNGSPLLYTRKLLPSSTCHLNRWAMILPQSRWRCSLPDTHGPAINSYAGLVFLPMSSPQRSYAADHVGVTEVEHVWPSWSRAKMAAGGGSCRFTCAPQGTWHITADHVMFPCRPVTCCHTWPLGYRCVPCHHTKQDTATNFLFMHQRKCSIFPSISSKHYESSLMDRNQCWVGL